MRIIAGAARGRRIYAPEGNETRPTTDRTRESLFNIISARIYGARFLDVFAGSGAVGLEALSRGASVVVAFESGNEAFRCIKRNAGIVEKGTDGAYRPVRGDAIRLLNSLHEPPFDIVYLDPPYDNLEIYLQAASILKDRGLVDENSVLILETRTGTDFPCPEGYTETDTRCYGEATLRFYGIRSGSGEDV